MSCSTLNQQLVKLAVSMGALPEGFCPATMQELANAIADRLIVAPNQNFSSFAIGSQEPTSNVGPWFRNCEEFWFFDDAIGAYRPIVPRGAFTNVQVFTANGTFTAPVGVFKVKVEAFGGGGGGSNNAAAVGGGGGGGGAYGMKIFEITQNQSIPVVVGVGGAGGGTGGDGTASTFLTLSTGGGKGGGAAAGGGGPGGDGGVVTGADFGIPGSAGNDSDSITGQGHGGDGGDAGGGGGSGGRASATAAHLVGIVPGGGGSGGTNALVNAGGAGANGTVVIWF